MDLLPPSKYKNITSYFKDFYTKNKEKHSYFSYQYFSKATQWPNSLLNDIINERRKLTIARIIQFSSALKMNSNDTEYLIHLLMKDSKEDHVRDYYEKSIKKSFNADHVKTLEVDDDVFADIDYIVIHELLVWAKKKLDPQVVTDLLELSDSINPEKVNEVYQKLEEIGAIKFHGDEIEVLADNLFLSQNSNHSFIDIKKSYLEQTRKFVEGSYPPGLLNFVHLELPNEAIPDVIDRMTMLRNWIMETSQETRERRREGEELETQIFQVDLNLFPLFNKENITNINN